MEPNSHNSNSSDERLKERLPHFASKVEVEVYSEVESDDDFRDTNKKERQYRERSGDLDRKRNSKKNRRKETRSRRYSSDSSRSRSRSRSRSKSQYKSRHKRRSYSDYDSREEDEYSDYKSHRHGRTDSYKFQEPNSTIMVRGLDISLGENDIRQDILKNGILVKDIRLIRHRETGISRGFAFVEFSTIQHATKWMETKKGILTFPNQSQASLIYSVPKIPSNDPVIRCLADWYCTKCQGHNFKRREFCYKCQVARPTKCTNDNPDEFSLNPTSTIMLSNLDALTTEDTIKQAFEQRPSLCSVLIKSVRIARDNITNLSLGKCYVEVKNVADAIQLFTALNQDSLNIDSREVTIAYSKSTTPTLTPSSVAATALAAAQWSMLGGQAQPTASASYDEDEIEKMAEYSATLYAKTPEEHASYLVYYRDYYHKQPDGINRSSQGTGATNGDTNVMVNRKEESATVRNAVLSGGSDVSVRRPEIPKIPGNKGSPDMSRYHLDEASGYYYDNVSSLYYDPATKYFYDAKMRTFLYWSDDRNHYVPVSNSVKPIKDALKANEKQKCDKKTPDRVNVAKKIAKDMEKWAKTLNQKKDIPKCSTSQEESYVVSDDAPQYKASNLAKRTIHKGFPEQSTAGKDCYFNINLNSYGDDMDSDGEIPNTTDIKPELVDISKLSCILCKRRFPTKDILLKHVELSEMHKNNLESLTNNNDSKIAGTSSHLFSSSYRDRAKERRSQFGFDKNEAQNSLKDLYLERRMQQFDVMVKEDPRIKGDNLGNRMLQKMGWQEGQGLGKGNQGRTEIITTQKRVSYVGLGLKGSLSILNDDDDRYSKARKVTLARYKELDN